MKTWKKISLCIVCALLCFVLVIGVLFYGIEKLVGGMCGNSIIQEVLSPDQKFKVIVFVRDCGATTGFTTHASLISSIFSLENDGGNIFACDTNHGKAPSGPGGGPKIEASWKDNGNIIIKYHENVRIFKTESKIKDIKIAYEKY